MPQVGMVSDIQPNTVLDVDNSAQLLDSVQQNISLLDAVLKLKKKRQYKRISINEKKKKKRDKGF